MNVILVLSMNVAVGFLIGGAVVVLASGLWSLVVAAQRSIWWLLAVIFIPFASIAILFVEPRSRNPFVAGLCGVAAIVCGYLALDETPHDSDPPLVRQIKVVIQAARQQQLESATSALLPLEVRKQRIVSWQKELEAKKTALPPNDAAAKGAFDEEFIRYLAALDKVKADMASLPKN